MCLTVSWWVDESCAHDAVRWGEHEPLAQVDEVMEEDECKDSPQDPWLWVAGISCWYPTLETSQSAKHFHWGG